jgi:2-dehydro-3-deoxygalactonokinase
MSDERQDRGRRIVSCDWGTSNFRIRLVDPAIGEVLCEQSSQEGISVLDQSRESLGMATEDRAKYLCRYLDGQLDALAETAREPIGGLPVIVSGMASSNLGIRPLPYALVPFRLDGTDSVWTKIEGMLSSGGPIYLLSGVSSGSDMLRGEEVELIGVSRRFSALANGAKESVVVLPGTHSKHVRISDGRITGIDTYLTGELFSLVRQYGVLRNSLRAGMGFEEGRASFLEGVIASGRIPLLRALFGIRARHVLQAVDPAVNQLYLSGLLIGHELRALPVGDGVMVYLCAGSGLETPYRAAMEVLYPDRPAIFVPADLMSRACAIAHSHLYQTLFGD